MKQLRRNGKKNKTNIFLTHTVQMKRIYGVFDERIFDILNPHGSDETDVETVKSLLQSNS